MQIGWPNWEMEDGVTKCRRLFLYAGVDPIVRVHKTCFSPLIEILLCDVVSGPNIGAIGLV